MRRSSRLPLRFYFRTLVVLLLTTSFGIRSADAVCTAWFTVAGITLVGNPTSTSNWFLNNCAILVASTGTYTPASQLTWTTSTQLAQFKDSWVCAEGGVSTTGTLNSTVGNSHFVALYYPLTCTWQGTMFTGVPTNALTVSGNGTQLAGVEFNIHSEQLDPINGTNSGTFVAVPGSTLTFSSTAIVQGGSSLGNTATTSWAWTNTIPTSPGSSTVINNLFPSTSSSGTFVPTYAGSVSVISKTAAGATDEYPVGSGLQVVTPTQPYTLATKIFYANNNSAIGALYSDGVSSLGTSLSSPITGGGIGAAVDATGNVWSLASSGNGVSVFNDQGALSTTYTGASLSAAKALAIDGQNRTWFANANSITAMSNAGAAVFSNAVGTAANINAPKSIAIDNTGSLWVANSGNNTVTEMIGVAAPVAVPVISQVANVSTGSLP